MKKFLFSFLLWGFFNTVFGQQFYIEASTTNPKVGEPFEVVVNLVNVKYSELKLPGFMGLQIVGTSNYKQNINGKIQHSFVHTLVASTPGSHRILGAEAVINGKRVKTQDLLIKVEKNPRLPEQNSGSNSPASNKKEPYLALSIESSKPFAYLGEPIEISYVLYANTLGIYSFSNQVMPQPINALIKEKIENKKRDFKSATYDGKSLSKLELVKLIIQPTQVGTLTVPEAGILVTLDRNTQANTSYDIFDFLFGSEAHNKIYEKFIRAAALKIPVKSLPSDQVPAGFKGAIGTYSMEVLPIDTVAKQGESIAFRVLISGTGNINLSPEFNFQNNGDWDAFKPVISSEVNDSTGIPFGKLTYTFSIIPKKAGKVLIPSQKFVFFNPDKGVYEVLQSEEIGIHVNASDLEVIDETLSEPVFKERSGITWVEIGVAMLALVFSVLAGLGVKKIIDYTKSKKLQYNPSKFKSELMTIRKSESDVYTKLENWLIRLLKEKYGIQEFYTQSNRANYLAERGVSESDIPKIIRIFEQSQSARYAPMSAMGLEDLFSISEQII